MSAFVRKEIRLQLPVFIIGWLCAISIWLLPNGPWRHQTFGIVLSGLPSLICPAMLLMMSVSAFGGELNPGTFSNLLAQPISRARIWRIKTAILAVAFAIILVTSLLCGFIRATMQNLPLNTDDPKIFWESMVPIILGLSAIYSGGMWTVLLLRQVAAAFWFTLLAPVALFVTILLVTGKQPADMPTLLIVCFSLYSIGGFLWARRMFLNAQDVQGAVGTVELPRMRGFTGLLPRLASQRQWRPRMALIAKEFQLHQSIIVLAACLALLHLGLILWCQSKGDLRPYPTLDFLLKTFWLLWLVFPVLIGSAAIAEERKLGTLAAQLCLSAHPWRQFSIKLAVVLFLSVGLGAVMPVLFEDGAFLPAFYPSSWLETYRDFATTTWQVIVLDLGLLALHWLPLLVLTFVSCLIGLISFYASSLTKTTLQALPLTVLGISLTATLLYYGCGIVNEFLSVLYWLPWPAWLVAALVFMCTLAGLAYGNFRGVLGNRRFLRNLIVLFEALAGTVALITVVEKNLPAGPLLHIAQPSSPARYFTERNPPLNASFLRLDSIPDGSQIAYYSLSNHTDKPVEMIVDDHSLPYYFEYKFTRIDEHRFSSTNYNLEAFFHSHSSSLPPNSAVTFPVRLPTGTTGYQIYLCYQREKTELEVRFREIQAYVTRPPDGPHTTVSDPYQNFYLPMPWEHPIK